MICLKCQIRETDPRSTKKWCKECRLEAKQTQAQWKKTHSKGLHGGNSYYSREFVLKSLGFPSYYEYLNSGLWMQVRTKVFRIKGRLCVLCGGFATTVHHNRYHKNDFLGKNINYLFPVCGACHKDIEFSKKHRKVALDCAVDRFNQRYRKRSRMLSKLLLEHDAEP